MAVPLKSTDEYRQQAGRLRVKAALAATVEARDILSQLALDYEILADSVAALERSRKSLSQAAIASGNPDDSSSHKPH